LNDAGDIVSYRSLVSDLVSRGYVIKKKMITCEHIPTHYESKIIINLVRNHGYDFCNVKESK